MITEFQSTQIALEIYDQAIALNIMAGEFRSPWGERQRKRLLRLMSERLNASAGAVPSAYWSAE